MRLRKFFLVLVVIFCVSNCARFFDLSENCRADTPITLYVGAKELYTSIQDAIESSLPGYRIFVYNGTYYENLIINHRIDLFGEDCTITNINGNATGTVITVNSNNVNISHFTISNGGRNSTDSLIRMNGNSGIITDTILCDGYHGIVLNNSHSHFIYDNIIKQNAGDGVHLNHSHNNINITYNTILGNRNGLWAASSVGNKIYNNIFSHNDKNGVFLDHGCINSYIVGNNCSNNNHSGIYCNDESNYLTISNNQVHGNNDSGLVLQNCSFAFIINGNIIQRNTNYGIMLIGSSNVVQSNTITYNKKDGLYLSADDNNTISTNVVGYNDLAGVRLYNSTNNYISSNEIYNNKQYGVYLDFFTIGNSIYNNYFHDNAVNAIDKSFNRNRWNTSKTSGVNVIGCSNISGNYWDDFDEISEGAYDNNNDGIADSPYWIYSVNKDSSPILDTKKPCIGVPQAYPTSQTLGKPTEISVDITDNTKAKAVYLVVVDPTGGKTNLSITTNKIGNRYNLSKIFTIVGNYSYSICAKDPRNWNHSANHTFSIRPGNPPTITDYSPTTGAPSAEYLFNVSAISTNALASDIRVFGVWNHANKSGNLSLSNVAGTNYFKGAIVLNSSIADMTYYFYVTDTWGNRAKTANKIVNVIDVKPPVIRIIAHGPSFEYLPNSHTFTVKVVDDSSVSNVTIEYWYDDSQKKLATMDALGDDFYTKVIIPPGNHEKIFCVIYASDIAGNVNNTKKPIVCHGGPYHGYVLEEITFNGSQSFDLDGSITDYLWDFGDGTTAQGSTVSKIYSSIGTYTVTLTVTDDDENQASNTTRVSVSFIVKHKIALPQLALVNSRYHLSLTEPFFCYDSTGDGVFDTFIDPNNVLFAVHSHPVNISGNISFLLSIGDDLIPEFFWDTWMNQVFPIRHTIGIIQDVVIDDEKEKANVNVVVDKDQWIYIEIEDMYPNSPVTISTNNRVISETMRWRKNQRIYVFDDPGTEYLFVFDDIFPKITATFVPADGGVINEDNPTIKIMFNVPVYIISAIFGSSNVTSDIIHIDATRFWFSPPGYLENGTYHFEISAQALQGNGHLSSTVVYFYFSYEPVPQQSFLEKNWIWILCGGFLGALGALLMLFRLKNISIDGFIYLKNRRIIPFFKSIIIGPVSVQILHENLSKAEFYVDGELKDEVTTFPAFWQWDENAFLKHTIETKVYDLDGHSVSSGEMEFFIFNFSKNSKGT